VAGGGSSPLLGGEGQGEGERNFYEITLTTCPNQSLIGTQQVAWLHFTAISNQSSAFVPLLLDNAVGLQPDGTEVRNFAPQAGRVVIVGEEPLLEALPSTNGQVQVILYARPGATHLLQTTVELPAQGSWSPWQQVTPTSLIHAMPLPTTNQTLFIRALRQ
jgi:hypothetical protein